MSIHFVVTHYKGMLMNSDTSEPDRPSRFPWLRLGHEPKHWLAAILIAIIGHSASVSVLALAEALLSSNERHGETHSGREAFLWLFAFVLSTVWFYSSFTKPHRSRLEPTARRRAWIKGIRPWLCAIPSAMSLYGLATAIHRWFSGEHFSSILFAIYLIALIVSLCGIYFWRDPVTDIYTARASKMTEADKRSHLILILSEVTDEFCLENSCWPSRTWFELSDPPDLDADLDALVAAKKLERKWPWEMPLRAMRAHIGDLRQVILLCSRQSVVQAGFFGKFVHRYPVFENTKVLAWTSESRMIVADPETTLGAHLGISFNDVNALSSALSDLLRELTANQNVPAEKIIIDFTGGQKPVSFIAAAATMRGEILSQYIDTAELQPYIYDIQQAAEVHGIG